MSSFDGFSNSEEGFIPIPAVFFSDLLLQIDDIGELRISLYAFWSINEQPREPGFLRFSEILKDSRLMNAFGNVKGEQEKNLLKALERACQRGILVEALTGNEIFYFMNSARGRAAREGLIAGKWMPDLEESMPVRLQPERPNIFALYEQNIGSITPILAETLQEAEKTYPLDWIEEALKIAVIKNVRNWRYVEAILKGWKEKGRNGTDWRSTKEDRKRDSEGKFGDYIKH